MTNYDYNVYALNEPLGKPKRWVRVGAAWKKKGGEISINMDCTPVNFTGQIYMFPTESEAPDDDCPFEPDN